MPERFSFPDDRHRDARLAEIKRYCEGLQHQQQEFLTSLTTDQLQAIYEQMFAGTIELRLAAILRWPTIVIKKHLVLPEVRRVVVSVNSFQLLRELIENEAELQLRTAAIVALSHIFESSQNLEVSKFLANLVANESLDRALRLRSYAGLWNVNHEAQRSRRKLAHGDQPRLKPTLMEYSQGLIASTHRFLEESRHFMSETRRADFSLEDDIRWDWVLEFTQ